MNRKVLTSWMASAANDGNGRLGSGQRPTEVAFHPLNFLQRNSVVLTLRSSDPMIWINTYLGSRI